MLFAARRTGSKAPRKGEEKKGNPMETNGIYIDVPCPMWAVSRDGRTIAPVQAIHSTDETVTYVLYDGHETTPGWTLFADPDEAHEYAIDRHNHTTFDEMVEAGLADLFDDDRGHELHHTEL